MSQPPAARTFPVMPSDRVERNRTFNDAPALTAEPVATRTVRGGGGLSLHVREWGNRQGLPIVFIHGWSQSQLCWARQVSGQLAEDFHLVTFDNRGHGMSDKPLDADSYLDPQLWADDLAAVIDQACLDEPVLVGWSYGGFILTDYVRAYGDEGIAGINLVGSAVVLRPPTFDHLGPGLLENAEGACVPDLTTNIAAVQRFLRACSSQALSRDEWSTALCWNMVVPAEVRAALIAREIDADDVLSSVSVPVLVSHGRADMIVLPSMAEHVLGVCKTATPAWYDGVGHMPFLEDPIRFNRELGDFVSRVTSAGEPSVDSASR
jgi:non-heme chloroperoxidase